MGSQPSKQESAIEACLADFPEHERTNVLNLFDKLCKGVTPTTTSQDAKKGHVDDQDTIDPQQFNAYFTPLLPPILLTCFRVTMQMHSAIHDSSSPTTDTSGHVNGGAGNRANRRQGLTRSTCVDSTSRISKYGWVMTIHRLSKTSIEEQAGLSFMLQTHDKSLESFVANVTRAVMVFWLAGEVGSWKDIPEEDVEGTTGFLLTRHLKKNSGKNEFESDDEDSSATGGGSSGADGLDTAGQEWLETATKRDGQGQPSGKEMSRSAFLNWYQQTVEYQIMFTILIQNLFLGKSTLTGSDDANTEATPRKRTKMPAELENKLCQKNYIAPRIRGGIEAAPHYSRLLTVADFFQLRYALPTPTYSMTASTGTAKKGSSGGGGGGLEQNLSETRPTPPLKMLFSSKTSGASFSTLLQKISYQGPTLVVMKDEDGYIFGAYADQDWEQGPKFYGTDRSFLFTIRPTFRIYRPNEGINSNFQYLDSGTKTLPNGIGFGGQLRYFGLWLASDFHTGHSAAEPLCSTFQSPRLSKQQNFKLEEMEVWQVHPSTIERDDLPKHSAMDTHPDAVALLEMANRKMYSKDVRAPENIYDDDE
ncbi:hypothetical protein BGZ96_003045 [Linnemannia gamsii]|uniref:MTOR-associated protein MEAK7 n=1 Tax=Linnemannia gamsii TaxID=64522 RepID=A0ABQ7K821_9FUNG|nr:hypothetical protein BGZ96_003045 [Linnemannia gamsii]